MSGETYTKLLAKGYAYDNASSLTHSFPMHRFTSPWKHQKTSRFYFQGGGIEKGCIGIEWVKEMIKGMARRIKG